MSKIYNLDAINVEPLPSPKALKQELPTNPTQIEFVHQSRSEIKRILDNEDPRLLLIVGPCSIHDIASAKEYAIKLRELSDRISKTFFVVMRVYFEKPRTALGWKGMLHDPHLNGTNDIHTGLRWSRELLLFLADLGIPTATEFLDPAIPRYLGDLISWGCIGARTSESQIHRQFASGLPMPVAFKNNTSGNIEVAVNGVLSATCPHAFLGTDDHGSISVMQTKGNLHAHLVLRGGDSKPNYDPQSISFSLERLKKLHLPLRLIIDCSHDNSCRQHEQQIPVFQSVIQQYMQGNTAIKGVALESHLFAGNQMLLFDKSRLQYAVSVTDPCMDWKTTEDLILWGKAALEKENAPLNMKSEQLSNGVYAQI